MMVNSQLKFGSKNLTEDDRRTQIGRIGEIREGGFLITGREIGLHGRDIDGDTHPLL